MVTYDQAVADLRQRCAESGTDITVQALVWDGSAYLAKPWRGRDELERVDARRGDEAAGWPVGSGHAVD